MMSKFKLSFMGLIIIAGWVFVFSPKAHADTYPPDSNGNSIPNYMETALNNACVDTPSDTRWGLWFDRDSITPPVGATTYDVYLRGAAKNCPSTGYNLTSGRFFNIGGNAAVSFPSGNQFGVGSASPGNFTGVGQIVARLNLAALPANTCSIVNVSFSVDGYHNGSYDAGTGFTSGIQICYYPTVPVGPSGIIRQSCSGIDSRIEVEWTGGDRSAGWYVDFRYGDANWLAGFYNKSVGSGTTITTIPNGSSAGFNSFIPGEVWYVRLYSVATNQHSGNTSMTAPQCAVPNPSVNVTPTCSGINSVANVNWTWDSRGGSYYVLLGYGPHSYGGWANNFSNGSTNTQVPSGVGAGSTLDMSRDDYWVMVRWNRTGQEVYRDFAAADCPPNLTSVTDTCTATGVSQFTAMWTGIPNSGFRLDISTSSSFTSYSSWSKGTATSHTDDRYPAGSPQFTAGTTYYLRVYNGLYSNTRWFVANTCPPSQPTISQVCDANGFAQVTIQWSGQPRPVGPAGANGFYVYMADNPGFSNQYQKWQPVSGSPAAVSISTFAPAGFVSSASGAPMQPLVRSTTYHVRVYNGAYSSPQSFVTINCPPKNVSYDVFCSSTGVSSVNISWTGQPGNNIGPSSADGFYAHLATNSVFTANHYSKWVGNVYNTTAPNSFTLDGVGTPMPGLGNSITWYVRIFNGNNSDPPSVTFTPITCRAPYLKAYGGDVRAGDGFRIGPSCPPTGPAEIRAFNNGSPGTVNAGAGGQAGVFATGNILEFVSVASSLPTSILQPLKGATFSNTAGNPSYGGSFGSNACVPDWYAGGSSVTATSAGTYNVSSLAAGAHRFDGSTTLNIDAVIPNGKQLTIYVNGHVTLTGTSLSYSGGPFATPANIPSVTIIARNHIYVNSSVQRLDGVFVSQLGTMFTCTNGSTLLTMPGLVANCTNSSANRLIINGAVMTPRIRFLRFPYSVADASHTENAYSGAGIRAAETFNFSPDFWISDNLPTDGTNPNRAYDSVTNPPPVL